MNTDNTTIRVTDAPFNAIGDGITDDRKAIQAAIDYVSGLGGGTVILDADKIFAVTGIVIKTGVTLFFEDNATLLQTSELGNYVKPVGDTYEPYTPVIGHNYSDTIKWSHTWYKNYPFIFAPEDAHHFAIKGNGIVKMAECDDATKLVRICPIGFYKVHDFEICDITITNYHCYAIMPFTCNNGLFSNLKINNWTLTNADGICMMNCQNIRITGCKMFTGDDSVYIFSSYNDPRGGEWWSSSVPQPSLNIEIDHNDLTSYGCKAFAMILWGIDCPDLENVEVRNIYVHDNHFATMGVWLYNPYTVKNAPHPVTNVRFENNIIDEIQSNFFDTVISDMTGFYSMKELRNGNFEDGKVFWNMTDKNVKIVRGEENFAVLKCSADVDVALWQGLFMERGKKYSYYLTAKVTDDACRMFIKNSDTKELISYKDIANNDKERLLLEFEVPKSGNYLIGIEKGDASSGEAYIYEAEFAGIQNAAPGYSNVTKHGSQIVYHYN